MSDQESLSEQQEINFDFDTYPEYDEYMDVADDHSEASSESYVLVGRKHKKKVLKKKKVKVDPGQRKIKKGSRDMTYFATSIIPGGPIRDAIYGGYIHDDLVGANDESLYFKVAYAGNGTTGEVDQLFYDNPEQFENHHSIKVSTDIKDRWSRDYKEALEWKTTQIPKTVNNIKIN